MNHVRRQTTLGIAKENITNAWKEKSVFKVIKAVGLGGAKVYNNEMKVNESMSCIYRKTY